MVRNTASARRILSAFGATIGVCALSSAAFAQVYTIRELKPHGDGYQSTANSINSDGTIVGAAL